MRICFRKLEMRQIGKDITGEKNERIEKQMYFMSLVHPLKF